MERINVTHKVKTKQQTKLVSNACDRFNRTFVTRNNTFYQSPIVNEYFYLTLSTFL